MVKYIIAIKDGHLRHYKSDIYSHNDIASFNGIKYHNAIIEKGIIQDNQCYIVECENSNHFNKKDYQSRLYVRDILDFKSRACESRYLYREKVYSLPDGDWAMKNLKIYHYSNQDFKGKIEPSYFGLNSYSKSSYRDSDIDRSFFYIGKGKEYFLNGTKFCYIVEIEQSKIYDLTKDIKNFKAICKDFTDILSTVKKLGYYGIKGNNGFDVVCLFKAIKYIDKRYLTRG